MSFDPKYHKTEQQINHDHLSIEAAKADRAKFDVLYNKYYEPILQFIYKRVDGKDMAYDITSQVFLIAMVHLPKYKITGVPFSAWLYRIAINEINKLFRRNKVRRTIKIDEGELNEMFHEMEEESIETRYQPVLRTLSLLPDEEIHMIEMRFFEKRSFKEIGEILNITENNSKVKVYRILDKLKGLLKKNN